MNLGRFCWVLWESRTKDGLCRKWERRRFRRWGFLVMKRRRAMILMSRSFEGGDGVFAIKRDCWWEWLICEEKKTSSLPFSFTKTLCQFYSKAVSNSFDSPALLSMDSYYHLRKCYVPRVKSRSNIESNTGSKTSKLTNDTILIFFLFAFIQQRQSQISPCPKLLSLLYVLLSPQPFSFYFNVKPLLSFPSFHNWYHCH